MQACHSTCYGARTAIDRYREAGYDQSVGARRSRRVKPSQDNVDAWELETSPIWHLQGSEVVPNPLCLKWWQGLAERKYEDEASWLEIAYDLGYVMKLTDPKSGNITYEPYGFEYDGALIRKSLGLPQDGPLVFREASVNSQPYQRLWNRLLGEEINEGSSDLG